MDSECPCCRAQTGDGVVTIETREFRSTSILTGRSTYLVRTTSVPGLCAACVTSVRRGRMAAGVLCIAPLLGLFGVGVALDARSLMMVLLGYLVYLAGHLDYTWADRLLYGDHLEGRLSSFVPPGDGGTTRFPVGWAHIGLRVGLIPSLVVAMVFLGALLGPFRSKSRPPADPPSASMTPGEAAAARLELCRRDLVERELLVPRMKDAPGSVPFRIESRQIDGRPYKVVVVYDRPEVVPPGLDCTRLRGTELIERFLRHNGYAMLVVEGSSPPLKLWRYELQKLVAQNR